MTMDFPGFHARDRWFFRREDDGSVRILAPDSLGPGASQKVVLDPNTWASVVASVSASGEDGATFGAAERFHGGASSAGARPEASAEEIAQRFHEAYERLAPEHGYETREASAKPWADVPEQNRGLMVATVQALLDSGAIRT